MNKTKPGGDRKVEGGREGEGPRLISSQTLTAGIPISRPIPTLPVSVPGHTYIVQSQQGGQSDVKNFAKLTRPIAPAPPVQSSPTQGKAVPSSQANIPTNLMQLGSGVSGSGNTSVIQQAPIPINMLRGPGPGQQHPSQVTFNPNFSAHIPRGTTTLTVPKTSAILRQGPPPTNLQIPNPSLNAPINLPLVRQPVRTTMAQATRSPSPAIGGQPLLQAQPQDLSRASFPLHGSITPVSSGIPGPQHPMQITLNRMTTPIAQDLLGRSSSTQIQNDSNSSSRPSLQQRINAPMTMTSDTIHQRLTSDLPRSNLPFNSQPIKMGQPLNSQGKGISPQPLIQHMPMKSVNLAVSAPVMLNSINPSMGHSSTTTTMASSAPIPIVSSATLLGGLSASSISGVHPSSSLSLPASSLVASTLAAVSESALLRQDPNGVHGAQGPSGGVIINPDFQTRPPGSILTMTTLSSSVQGPPSAVMSHPENRVISHPSPQMGLGPADPMWLQHYMYQASQPPMVPTTSTLRPGSSTFAFLPSHQATKMQTAASNPAASQLAALSNVRYNPNITPNMLVMDQLRQQHQQQQQQQQQHSLHSAFSSSAAVSSVAEKLASLASRATVASSIYTASVGVQSHMAGGGGGSGLSAVPVSNPSSSPRPSILRKRPSEATGVVIRKPNFNLNQEARCHSPPRLDSVSSHSVASPKISVKNYHSPVSENSQSSTDTALSSNDATTPTHNHIDKGKVDGEECSENGPTVNTAHAPSNNIPASPAVSHTGSIAEASPRKRARKQLLHANEDLKETVSATLFRSTNEDLKDPVTSSDEEMESLSHGHEEEYTDEDGVRWVLEKPRPSYVLIQPECINSKTRHNHFTRYSDVKPKEERRPTVNELSNQRGINQKVNGWRLYFSASQLEELMEVERDMEVQFAEIKAALSILPHHKASNDESTKIKEMSQANIQRCQLIQNQLTEARSSMIKTLDHKPRIQEIVSKHMSKRPIKKKERT